MSGTYRPRKPDWCSTGVPEPQRNGVPVLIGISGGDRTVEVPGDHIMLGFVLGNKVVVGSINANRTYFERGVQDMAPAEAQYPGWRGC